MKTIFTSLSPNTEADDVRLAAKLLFLPWKWRMGSAVAALQDRFRLLLGVPHAFAFASGRTSLYALLSCLNLGPDDEVLLQAYTCVAVPDPILWAEAKPVYVDCDEATFNMSSEDLERRITSKSKVLIIQHTFGQPADLENLIRIAKQHGLFVIEDCAHALGALYRGRLVGTYGDAAFFSFGRDKVLSSVFGGVATTRDSVVAAKLSSFQSSFQTPSSLWVIQQLLHPLIFTFAKATYSFFHLGKVIIELSKRFRLTSMAVYACEKQGGKPSFVSHAMPNALALLALFQLDKLDRFHLCRQKIADRYTASLSGLPIALPPLEEERVSAYLRYSIQISSATSLLKTAKKEAILLGNWYTTPVAPDGVAYDRIGYRMGDCPVAEKLASSTVNLPTHVQMTDEDVERVIDFVKKWLKHT